MFQRIITVLLGTIFVVISGCVNLDVPLTITATNNEHKPLLYNELSAATATETSFTGDFVFQNKSPEPLSLELKMTSCGCLSLQKDGQEIKQGDRFTISGKETVTVFMTMQMPFYPGKNEYKATFVTNHQGRDCDVEITMSCPIIDDISVNPKIVQVVFDRESTTNHICTVFLVRSSRNKTELESLPTLGDLPDHITLQKISVVSKSKIVAEGIWQKEWQFDFNVVRSDEIRMLEAPWQIDISVSDCSAGFSFILTKTYGIDYPKQIDFPDTKPDETKTRVFSLQSASGTAFEIKSISCNNSCFVVLARQVSGKSKQHWIEVDFVPHTVGENRAILSIETSHPDSDMLTIELKGTCSSDNHTHSK